MEGHYPFVFQSRGRRQPSSENERAAREYDDHIPVSLLGQPNYSTQVQAQVNGKFGPARNRPSIPNYHHIIFFIFIL
jgi:hypothetical protein